jgi:hypothetical protein
MALCFGCCFLTRLGGWLNAKPGRGSLDGNLLGLDDSLLLNLRKILYFQPATFRCWFVAKPGRSALFYGILPNLIDGFLTGLSEG